jgi:hypothetical protein
MSDGFQIDPDAVRSIAGNIGGILMQAITLTRDLQRLTVPPTSYAELGVAVANNSEQLQAQQGQALHSLLEVVADITHEVSTVAATSRQLDSDIGAGLDRLNTASSLWSSPTASQLASMAMADGAQHTGTGHSVDGVLGYMGSVGMGNLSTHPVDTASFHSPTALADWLDTDPDNQTQLGVIGVYAGDSGNLSDVPGGVHPGDLVYVARWQLGGSDFTAGTDAALGVIGNDGQLYNNGAISTDWHGVTDLRVYRPLSEAL